MPVTSTEMKSDSLREKNMALEEELKSLSVLAKENNRLEAALAAALADVQTMKGALNRFQLGKDSLTAQARALLGTLALMPSIKIVQE